MNFPRLLLASFTLGVTLAGPSAAQVFINDIPDWDSIESADILALHERASEHHASGRYNAAITDYNAVVAGSITPFYRVHALTSAAQCWLFLNQPFNAIAATDVALADPHIFDRGLESYFFRALTYKADAYRQLGDLDQAIATLTLGTNHELAGLFSWRSSDLYIQNGIDESTRGNRAAADVWFMRAFEELDLYGFPGDKRELHRLTALRPYQSDLNSREYRERSYQLATHPKLVAGRMTPQLLLEEFFHRNRRDDLNGVYEITELVYEQSLLNDWHKPHEEQFFPDQKSRRVTDMSRHAILLMLTKVALDPYETVEQLEMNIAYAVFLLEFMADTDMVIERRSRLEDVANTVIGDNSDHPFRAPDVIAPGP